VPLKGTSGDFPSELRITEVSEKPTQEYAKQKLVMADPPLDGDTMLTMFGQYVLDPSVFTYLEEHVANNVRQNGAFNLSLALDQLRKDKGLIGVCLDGERFNISTPSSFQRATMDFSVY
jgi:UTP-glucose-1-phosphate uridylyltransferase